MTLPYSASIPAAHADKLQECLRAGRHLKNLLAKDLKPRDIVTRKSIDNAITIVNILGGSTNAVLHLLAIARAGDIPLVIEDFATISRRTPFLGDLKPSGKYLMASLHEVRPFAVAATSPDVLTGADRWHPVARQVSAQEHVAP